ncbi:Bacterial PH-like domain [Phytophthora cinnamomi]|uniref:Bacterial PH-like domain n=1 Tax=Phytophthora cinnamomi TaxID=4785 RepID=UPI0035596C1E|nr:Bacterial PH-like domain [Phytophthora cinnamomi]
MASLVKGLAGDLTGSADVCKIVADFSKCQASEYLLPSETIAFSMVSCKEEFTFTNMALITLEGESATTTRKMVERYEYKDDKISQVKFESAGHVDRDCEIKFHIGSKGISIDVARGEQTSAQGIYKVLELISRAQVENERRWEISTLGIKHASEALRLTENSGQTLTKQSDEATAWLYEAYKRTHPHCYRDVIQAAFSDLGLVDKMAQ